MSGASGDLVGVVVAPAGSSSTCSTSFKQSRYAFPSSFDNPELTLPG